jgi:ferredoxin-NADP reductase
MDYILKVMSIEDDYPNVRRIVVVRPSGFAFDPGKGAMVSVNKLGLEDNKRRCTFFSLTSDYYLELLLNEESGEESNWPFFNLKAGEEIILSDVVGNLKYNGAGGFIAAGKGVFGILNIFKHLKKHDALQGHTLLYLARSQGEVYFDRLFKQIFPNNTTVVIGKDPNKNDEVRKVDEALLRQKLPDLQHELYITGPKSFVESTAAVLDNLGLKYQTDVFD